MLLSSKESLCDLRGSLFVTGNFFDAAEAISPQAQKQTRPDVVGTQTSFCLISYIAEMASSLKIAMFLTDCSYIKRAVVKRGCLLFWR